MRSKLFLLFFCLLLSGGRLFAVEAHPTLTLFSQLRIEHEDMAIAEDDWAWLRHKGHLRLGAALDETSPFNVRLDDENYEGITADVATLVGQLLGMRIKVVSFDTHADAVAALAAGKIDLLGSHYSSAGDSSLVLSQPYARDRLAVFKRMGEKRNSPEDLAGLSVAVAREHVGELRQRFPRARFVVFGSHDEAVAAVAFGHTDLYLDDVLSAYHRINRSYYGYVRFERFADARLEGATASSFVAATRTCCASSTRPSARSTRTVSKASPGAGSAAVPCQRASVSR